MSPELLLQVEGLGGRPAHVAGQPPAQRHAFEAVSFSVEASERVAIVDRRGADQRTLLRTVAWLQRPSAGRIYFEGQDLARLGGAALRRLRQRLQYVGGDPRYLLPLEATVAEALLEPLHIHSLGAPAEQRARIESAASLMGVNALLLDRKAGSLSPALRLRVALARAFTLHPRLLLCDDPADRLEPAAARPLLESVAHACRSQPAPTAWVWTTAKPELALAFSDRVLHFEDNRLEIGPG